MKGIKQRNIFLSALCLFIILLNVTEVEAMNTGFSTEELTQNIQDTFISNVNISLLTVPPAKRGIQCFDVNEQGMIAIGQKGTKGKEVCIYSSNGTFLYGYTFNCSQSFAVEWDNEYINIYFIRSDVIVSLDANGNIMDIKKVQDTTNNNAYRNNLLYSSHRTIGDTKYLVKNNMGIFNWIALTYSQIVSLDINGEECVIYDVSASQFSNTVVAVIFLFASVSIAIGVIVLQFIKLRHRY